MATEPAAELAPGEYPRLRDLLIPTGWPLSFDRLVAPRLTRLLCLPDDLVGRAVTWWDRRPRG